MAIFNPDVPDHGAPNYLGLSKSVTQPEGDKSAAFAGAAAGEGFKGIGQLAEGAGNIFKQAVSGLESYTEEKIGEDVRSGTEFLRDNTTKTLENMRSDPSLIQDKNSGPETPPAALQNIDSSIEGLNSGYEGGKFNLTYYYGQLATMAKTLRDKYPGHVDYVDKKIESITGFNSANKYQASLLADLNRNATSGQKEYTQLYGLAKDAFEKGVPGAEAGFNNVTSGKWTMADWQRNVGPEVTKHAQSKNAALEVAQNDTADARTWKQQETLVAREVNMKGLDLFKNLTYNLGMDGLMRPMNTPAGQDIADKLERARLGTGKMSGPEAIQFRGYIQTLKGRAEMSMDLWGNQRLNAKTGEPIKTGEKVDPKDVLPSPIERMGPEGTKRFNEMKTAGLQYYDRVANDLTEGKVAQAAISGQMLKAATDDFAGGIFAQRDLANAFMSLSFLDKHSPKLAAEYYTDKIVDGGTNTVFGARVAQMNLGALTQNDPGKILTQKEVLRTVRSLDNGGGTPAQYKSIVDVTNAITNPHSDVDTKLNAARASFTPGNQNFLENFKKEDKTGVFVAMTNPAVSKEMFKLKDADPDIWNHYTNWVQEEFANQLYSQEVKDLSKFNERGVRIQWDTENNKWKAIPTGQVGDLLYPPKNPREQYIPRQRLEMIQGSISRLNAGIANLSHVAEANGTDVGTYLLDRMKIINPDITNLSGIPTDMYESIIHAKKAEEGITQKGSQSPTNARGSVISTPPRVDLPHFAQEDKPVSLNDWLKNPDLGKPDQPIARSEIPSSRRVWGDREAEAAGLYEPMKNAPKGMTVQQYIRAKNGGR